MMLIERKPGCLEREPENLEVIYFLKLKIVVPNAEKGNAFSQHYLSLSTY